MRLFIGDKMTAIDKLTLELDIEGANQYIRELEASDDALKKTSKNIADFENKQKKSTSKIDKSEKKSDKLKKKIFNDSQKRHKKELKNYKEQFGALTKLVGAMAAFTGIGFTLSGIQNASNKATSEVTSLGNETKNMALSPKDLDGIRQALKLSGQNANDLDNLLNLLSDHVGSLAIGRGGNNEILNLLGYMNGSDLSGNPINQFNMDIKTILNQMSKMLQSNSKEWRTGLSFDFSKMGLTKEASNFLSNEKYDQYMKQGEAQSIINEGLVEQARKQKSQIETATKELENAQTEAGLKWTRANVKLTKIYTDLAKDSATLAPVVEDALDLMSVLIKGFSQGVGLIVGEDGIYTKSKKSAHKFLDDTSVKQYKAESQKEEVFKKYDNEIEYIDRDRGIIYFKNDKGTFDGGLLDKAIYSPYIYNYLKDKLENKQTITPQETSNLYNPETMKELSDKTLPSSVGNTSTTNNNPTNITINEMNVNTNENNAQAIVQNSVQDAGIVKMSGSSAMAFMYNYG